MPLQNRIIYVQMISSVQKRMISFYGVIIKCFVSCALLAFIILTSEWFGNIR